MRFAFSASLLALAASTVQAAGWLPPLLTPAGGEVYKVGDNITITWDQSGYNDTASATGKFMLVYNSDDETQTVAQFVGKQSSYGDEYDLWTGDNSLSFQIDYIGTAGLGQPIWSIVEFPLGEYSQQSGYFTVNAP
ncbi:hypothetical protein JCM10207_001719 [Rhodosporidiobolus poonsookiae]